MMKSLINVRIAFSILITVFFGYAAYEARSYMYLAKIFPLYISLAMFLLALINLIQEVVNTVRQAEHTGIGSVDLGSDWDIPIGEVWTRFGVYLGMLLVLYLCIWLAGYVLSLSVFIFLFYWRITGTRWYWAILAGLSSTAFTAVLDRILVIGWPSGLIQQWVSMPWPIN
jgi:hypothetical protein